MREKIYNIFKKSLNVFLKIVIILSSLLFFIIPFLNKLLDEVVANCIWYPSCAIFVFSLVKSVRKTESENKKNIFKTLALMSLIPIIVILSSAFVINYYDTSYNWFWCIFVLMLIYFPVLVIGMRNFYKKEKNYTAKELKTSAINASKYILFYLLLVFFYMAIFNYWISDSNSKDIWLTLQFVFGIAAMVFIFYSLTITFLSVSKKNRFGLLQDFILGVAITIYLIFIFPNSSLQSIVLTIIAAVYGGLLTLVGVAWTIRQTNLEKAESIKLSIKPYFYILNYIKDEYDWKNASSTIFRNEDEIVENPKTHNVGVIKNSDNGILIFEKIIINDREINVDFGTILDKNKATNIRIYNCDLENVNDFIMVCRDIQNNQLFYKCYIKDKLIYKIVELKFVSKK